MERTGFWTRMGQWFKSISAGEGFSDDNTAVGNGANGSHDPAGSAITRVRNPRANLERLEQEYGRVVKLIESVQKHLEEHGDRSERIAAALDKLAGTLSHVPDASRTQIDLLAKIGEKLSADAATSRNLEQSLSQLPRLADAQRETMVAIGRQLEASRESSERVATMLDGFHKGLAQVAESASATGRALEKTRWDSSTRDERLAAILQEQSKRLTTFAVAAISLASVAALASVIAMFF